MCIDWCELFCLGGRKHWFSRSLVRLLNRFTVGIFWCGMNLMAMSSLGLFLFCFWQVFSLVSVTKFGMFLFFSLAFNSFVFFM